MQYVLNQHSLLTLKGYKDRHGEFWAASNVRPQMASVKGLL